MRLSKINSRRSYGSIAIIVISISLFALAFHSLPFVNGDGTWWNTDWQYRKLITINHTKVEAPLSNFPVMVHLNSSNFDFNKTKANLEDIRFTDYDGNLLSYEIEKPTSGNVSGSHWSRVLVDDNRVYTDGAHNILCYDVDVDGNLELVTCSYRADSLQFYKYYGDSHNSSNWVRYVIDNNVGGGTGGSGAHYIAIADINSDGRMDLILAEDQQQEDVVAYLAPVDRLNMSAWQKHILFDDDTIGVYALEAGDIDGDGDPDICLATRTAQKLGWLENNGTLDNWPVTWIDQNVRDLFNAKIGDLNHDGKGEVVCNYASTSSSDGYYLWYNYSGDPRNATNWVKHTMANVGTGSVIGSYSLEIVDMDFDGNLDVVGCNLDQNDIYIFENPYPGDMSVLWPKYKVHDDYNSRDSDIVDIDGDGDLDIVGADSNKDAAFWLENPGNPFTPSWKDHVIDSSSSYLDWTHMADFGDIDGDGHLDVAVAAAGWSSSTGCTFQWYYNVTYQSPPPTALNDAVIWVKLPSISNDTDTKFYMYYGNPSAPDGQDSVNVWDSNYKMVQHLKEISGTHYDSTASDNDGTPQGGINQNATGKIDGADDFDGSNDYVDCGTNSSLEFGASQDLTLSTWMKIDSFATGSVPYNFIFIKRFQTDSYFYQLYIEGNTRKLVFAMWSGGLSSSCTVTSTETLNTGQWYFACVSIDRDDPNGAKLFVNLNQYTGDPRPASGSLGSGGHFEIGRSSLSGGCAYFDGIIDEIRVSNTMRNTAYIHATYYNQLDPPVFYTIGTEEAAAAKLYIDPPLTLKGPSDVCTTFKVNVTIQDVKDMWGFDFNLTWDNSLITLVSVDFNTTLDAIWGHDNWFLVNETYGVGYYKLATVSISTSFNSTGPTPLATLTFHVEDPLSNLVRETPIHFETHKLSDSHWTPIPHTTQDGTYRITGKKPTIKMSPTSVTCRRFCENFTIMINVSDAYNVEDFKFELHYDTAFVDYSNVTWNAWTSGTINVDEASGNITGSSSGSPTSGNLTLVTIIFHAAYHHIWKDLPGWTNNLAGTIFFQWANLSYPSAPDLGYIRGGLNQINVGPDVAYTFAPIQGDVDNDGDVDIFDLRTVAAFYDTVNPDYNLTGDNIIDIFDLVVIGSNFGFTYP